MNKKNVPIAIARGDGIGPEIMDAVLDILKAAGAELDVREVTIGEKAYAAGEKNGISDADMQTLGQCRALLKAPLSTPQGKGFSSANVMIRKHFDLFANVRPYGSFEPVLPGTGGATNAVIVRENIEDLYAGIEYRPTPDTAIGRKVATRSETERIIRMAFEYAKANGRTKVTGIAKDNIQKMTDGMFHDILDDVAKDYPGIESEFYIADIGIARLGARPQDFDVVVTQNMYGDIGSDVIGEALGSIGLNGSANIGEKFGMFEAVHGTFLAGAGKDIANPSGLLEAASMMLVYIGQADVAEKVRNAWLKTLEDGIHTGDIHHAGSSKKAGTKEFAQAVIERIGQKPSVLKPADYSKGGTFNMPHFTPPQQRDAAFITGVDFDIETTKDAQWLHRKASRAFTAAAAENDITLSEIRTVRGDKVWPGNNPTPFYTDCLTLRIEFNDALKKSQTAKQMMAADILKELYRENITCREMRMLTVNSRTLEKNFR